MKRFWPSLILAIILPVLGCGGGNRGDENASATERGTTADTTAVNDTNRVYTQDEMTAYRTQVTQDLQNMNQQLTQMRSRMANMTSSAQADMQQQLDRIQTERQTIQARVDSLETATGTQWTRIRIRVDQDLKNLRADLEDAGDKLQSQ
ncbi:MAG: hypothetical protein ACE15D_09950 [Candidatus Eisenbacteria bacterium]